MPIILLTARAQDADVQRGLRRGRGRLHPQAVQPAGAARARAGDPRTAADDDGSRARRRSRSFSLRSHVVLLTARPRGAARRTRAAASAGTPRRSGASARSRSRSSRASEHAAPELSAATRPSLAEVLGRYSRKLSGEADATDRRVLPGRRRAWRSALASCAHAATWRRAAAAYRLGDMALRRRRRRRCSRRSTTRAERCARPRRAASGGSAIAEPALPLIEQPRVAAGAARRRGRGAARARRRRSSRSSAHRRARRAGSPGDGRHAARARRRLAATRPWRCEALRDPSADVRAAAARGARPHRHLERRARAARDASTTACTSSEPRPPRRSASIDARRGCSRAARDRPHRPVPAGPRGGAGGRADRSRGRSEPPPPSRARAPTSTRRPTCAAL